MLGRINGLLITILAGMQLGGELIAAAAAAAVHGQQH
jgi:hypothetical protein